MLRENRAENLPAPFSLTVALRALHLCVTQHAREKRAENLPEPQNDPTHPPVAGKSSLRRPDSPELSHSDRFCPQRAQNLTRAREGPERKEERTVVLHFRRELKSERGGLALSCLVLSFLFCVVAYTAPNSTIIFYCKLRVQYVYVMRRIPTPTTVQNKVPLSPP